MATSSINRPVVIRGNKDTELLLNALERCEKNGHIFKGPSIKITEGTRAGAKIILNRYANEGKW